MRVALIESRGNRKYTCMNKDESGTFGTATHTKGTLFGKILGIVKNQSVHVPVLYLGYIAAIFKKYGHKTRFYRRFPNAENDIVIIASSIVDYKAELSLAVKIKKRYPKCKIGFIGAFSTVKPKLFMKYADFVILGEPEQAVIWIAEGRKEPKGIIKSSNIKDLDSLPFPDWDLFDIKEYSYFPMLRKKPLVTMLTSRGCPFACYYCPYLVMQKEFYRRRSPKNVVDEIQYLQKKYGVKSIAFRDPLFSLDIKRVEDICKEIIKRKIKIEWCCETRTDCLSKNIIDKMVKAGMRGINLGIESIDEKLIKKASRKPIKSDIQIKMVNYLHKKKVKVAAFYILGFLDDTEQNIERTINFAKKLNTLVAQFHVMSPYPGTKFYDKIKNRITTKDWEEFDGNTPIVKIDKVSQKRLLELKDKAFKEYYLRFGWITKHSWRLLI